jgi:hypothetical protein
MKKQTIIRSCLSPLVFIYGIFITLAMCLFPIPLIMLSAIAGMFLCPLTWLSIKTGSTMEYHWAFLNPTKSNFLNHFISFTIVIWGAFYIVWFYINTGQIYDLDKH